MELLVVVAIISVLLSMLMPAINAARRLARRTACASNERQFGIANTMYANENGGWYVPINGTKLGMKRWPSNETYEQMLGAGDIRHNEFNGLNCPTRPDPVDYLQPPTGPIPGRSYAWNWQDAWLPRSAGPDYARTVVQRRRVKLPDTTAQFVDSTDWHMWRPYANYTRSWDPYGERRFWSVAYRHNEGANVLHFDGSIRYYTKYDAWPDRASARRRLWDLYDKDK